MLGTITTTAPYTRPLTFDRSLRLEVAPAVAHFLADWAPLVSVAVPEPEAPGREGALIRVSVAMPAFAAPRLDPPNVELRGVRCWVDSVAERATIAGPFGCRGSVDLDGQRAELTVPADPEAADELRAACTIAAALLLARRDCALLPASAVIAPDGGGWLLVGGPHSGKSTTCANLVTTGWSYLADEEVVLHRGERDAWLEGWPRALALDEGWQSGRTLRRRASVDPATLGRGRWRRTAPLAGILFTRLEPDAPTRIARLEPEDSFAMLVTATRWLLADHTTTRIVAEILRAAARVPGFDLRLGVDSYEDASRLTRCLRRIGG